MIKQMYQGDVLIIQGIKIPEGLKFNKLPQEGLIVMEGEVSGHHHRIEIKDRIDIENVSWAKDDSGYYLKIGREAILTHPEHKTIILPKGIYYFGAQWEYDEILEKKVLD